MAWRKLSGGVRVWSPYEEHFCLPRILQIDLKFSLKPGISNYPVSKYVSHLRQGLSLCMAPDMMGHLFLMQVSACALCGFCCFIFFFHSKCMMVSWKWCSNTCGGLRLPR